MCLCNTFSVDLTTCSPSFFSMVRRMCHTGQHSNQDKLHWLSTNFKTLLTWEPEAGEPSYDVEYAE